jgi:hypothetical protein
MSKTLFVWAGSVVTATTRIMITGDPAWAQFPMVPIEAQWNANITLVLNAAMHRGVKGPPTYVGLGYIQVRRVND